ncbi:ABC transporter ATP-binding protein [uncultured Cetobacterium sp.]|uniref:ABC transporter ATP-binding protein n=1 Tax=uncultured Cetobacterium sp. TaxID=527638 RepID=UPI0026242F3A|nr:ABC transporter ATP-binding protein [uncultured Cetobacterium sp.]
MLEVTGISKNFKNNQVLKEINFKILDGESIAILGSNGAGKTTLIKIMLGLLLPTKGEVSFNNINIREIRSKYLKLIGVVLEGNRNIYWYLTPWENLNYFGCLLGIKKNDIKKRGKELLELFDLSDVSNEKIDTFSRGMKQKVAIIIALLNKPKILFLDEPTLGLDIITRNKLIDCLLKIKKEGTTIILTTHQLEIVDQIVDRSFFLKDGKLFLEKNQNNSLIFNEILIDIDLKKRGLITLIDGDYVQNLIIFLLENGEKINSIVKRNKRLEDIFLEIYRE